MGLRILLRNGYVVNIFPMPRWQTLEESWIEGEGEGRPSGWLGFDASWFELCR